MLRRVFRFPDGSQLLVTTRADGPDIVQRIATRPHPTAVWGPPIRPEYVDDDPTGIGS